MKLAFLHPENQFTGEMFRILQGSLARHELLSWVSGHPAPSPDIELLIALGKVGAQQLEGLGKLGFVQTASTGFESVDMEAATAAGIWVSFAPSDVTGNAISVAESAIMLLLAASHRLGMFLRAQGDPSIHPPLLHPALSGKTVCIVGLGGVGEQLAVRLRPFNCRITATDEHPEKAAEGITAYKPEQLREALREADYVVLCVRAGKENENLMDASMLAAMKPGAILINVARGTLLDESALLASLKDGHLAAAGLDVVRDEPLQPDNPLLTLPQIIAMPHIAGFTDIMLHGTSEFLTKVVGEVAAGSKPSSVLNNPESPRLPLR